MTMTHERWQAMPETERVKLRKLGGLTKQLIGLEGHRVEAVRETGEVVRFYVGRSTGWEPCHLEIKRINSSGGLPADRAYKSVRKLSARRIAR